jgi:hypothetical protein
LPTSLNQRKQPEAMSVTELYRHACELASIQPLDHFNDDLVDSKRRILRARGKGSLQPRLNHIQLDDNHVKALAKALKDDATVTILDIRHNLISDVGVVAIAELLEVQLLLGDHACSCTFYLV